MLFLHHERAHSYGRAATMGGLKNVSSDGPFDVLRNPATMSQNRTPVLGLGGLYNFMNSTSSSSSVEFVGKTDVFFDIEGPDNRFYQGNLSFLLPLSGEMTAGIGLFYGHNSSNHTRRSGDTAGNYPSTETSDQDTDTVTLHLPLSYRLTGRLSAGIRFTTTIEQETTKEDRVSYAMGSLNETRSQEETQRTIGLGFVMGIYYKTGTTELGISLNAGEYGFTAFRYRHFREEPSSPSNNYDISGNTSFGGNYTRGVGLSAGVCRRFFQSFGAAFELEITMPVNYVNTVKFNSNNDYQKTNQFSDQSPVYALRTGFEYTFFTGLTAGLGIEAQYSRFSEKQTTINNYNNNTLDIYSFLLFSGIHYSFNPGTTVSLLCLGNHQRMNMDMKSVSSNSTGTETMLLKLKAVYTGLSAGLALTQAL